MSEKETVIHTLPPVFDRNSRVLILGTMPSPASREAGFFYSHPQNRFWPVMAAVFGEPEPKSNGEKRAFLLSRRVALWDVLKSCLIRGADDRSIAEPTANDLSVILSAAKIQAVFTTGGIAAALYKRCCLPKMGIQAHPLPSTSPANCRYYDFDSLTAAYSVITKYI